MKKTISILLAIITAMSLMACGSGIVNDEVEINKGSTSTVYASSESKAKTLLEDMGRGINMGNALDVCDWNSSGATKTIGYQVAAVYSTTPWSAWDASSYQYFSIDGTIHFTWQIDSLNSDSGKKCNTFAIQIVSHDENAQNKSLTCNITGATFTSRGGQKYTLTDILGSHELTMQNDVTEYISQSMSGFDGISTTADVIGGTLELDIELEDYYYDSATEIAKLETSWGNPQLSEEMIRAISEKGFKTVRLPVTYFNYMSSDGTIEDAYLDRVEQVVDWIIKYDMYCLISIQHDTGNDGWIKASADNYAQNHEIVEYMIKQIAERFNSKGDHLILEGFNEMVNDNNDWGNIPISDLAIMNKWNQLFVDTVRATGGNNANRYLLVNTYAALPSTEVINGFSLPNDTADDKLLVGLHCYFKSDKLAEQFAAIKSFSDKYNVVIGEWAFWVTGEEDNRAAYATEYLQYADEYGIPAIWWDNGKTSEMALFDRNSLTWPYEELTQAILGE